MISKESAKAVMSITVGELAEKIGGRAEGDVTRTIHGVAPLRSADGRALSWIGHPKYAGELRNTQAAAVLVPNDCVAPAGLTVIRVADPDLAMCAVLRLLAPTRDNIAAGVHATATVASDACVAGAAIGPHAHIGPRSVIGANTQIHAGAYVGADVRVGRDCVIWPNVVIREGTIIGDRVNIHPNATIGADGFGYLQRAGRHVKVPQIGIVEIGDDVEIGANTCIDRAKSGVTRIGEGTKIDNLVQIAHNVEIGPNCIIVALTGLGGSCVIGEQTMIGGSVGVADHVRLGRGAMIAAKAGVDRDVADGGRVAGMPAVESRKFWRQVSLTGELPELKRELRRLMERIEKLESATDDQA
ncbi:MAG: UDP-3-O-(3-hydroxymyristoyl)glucosamine N-acyltransferase [Phycisphaerales bacterium]|nr:UDP-3-O-(3-hydroxymyristoyl)glucosamine N-acyltransferase [Phycisphaerales bacterium]